MAVGDQPSDQVDQEVDRAAVTRMLDLSDVFELIIDGLDNSPLAHLGLFTRSNQMQAINTFLPPSIIGSSTTVYAVQGDIYMLDAKSGILKQSYPMQSAAVVRPTLAHDHLYINISTRSANTIQALRLSDGLPLWSYSIEGHLSGFPTIVDGVAYVNTIEGDVYALQANDVLFSGDTKSPPIFLLHPPSQVKLSMSRQQYLNQRNTLYMLYMPKMGFFYGYLNFLMLLLSLWPSLMG